VSGYLRRLATTGAAYTAASVFSKLIAVALLPLYTRYLTKADYGAAEVMFAAVVSASIVVRLGMIEALLRFYYKDDEDPGRVVATSFATLFWLATAAALIALPFAAPISEALLGESAPDLARISIGGLWALTMFEYLLTLFRLEERARAYFVTTMLSVLAAIALTVILVVGAGEGARGLLLGSYASGAAFVLGLIWVHRRSLSLRVERPLLRRLLHFGLPTMPAELSLYMLNFVDRLILVRSAATPADGLRAAGLYSLAAKFAQGVNVLARGFQLAWPPLAYSIQDDGEARRVYATVVTWFAAAMAFVVAGMWLLSRWIVRALAAPEFFGSYKAIGLLATGAALYALYMVLVVILGRTGRTGFNFPATGAALASNIALNLLLVPPFGIVGAGVALVASYLVVLSLMYGFTQRLFPVPYEWGRLARALLGATALVAAGELLLPTEGAAGLLLRTILWSAYPLLLLATGFFTADERLWLARLRHPDELVAQLRSLRPVPTVDGRIPEAYEIEQMDEDARL
jgi:O-antigen/teichoic acid export membrane protein